MLVDAAHLKPDGALAVAGRQASRREAALGGLHLARILRQPGGLSCRSAPHRPAWVRCEREQDQITVSHIISSLGAYVTIEPMFYWRDALDPLHMRHLSEKNRVRLSGKPARPQARETVRRARDELASVMDAHGAVHAQIGRHYELLSRMTPGAAGLLTRIKAALDSSGRMNPGVLGLDPSCA
jgi:hypothetical protein